MEEVLVARPFEEAWDFDDLEVSDAPEGLDRAFDLVEEARRRASSEEAATWEAIRRALRDAAEHPWVFVGLGFRDDGSASDERPRAFAVRSAVADLAVRMRVAEQTVRMQAHRAEVLSGSLPLLWAEFRAGRTTTAIACASVELAASLPDAALAEFDAGLAPLASTLSPARFRDRARALRERLHPVALEERHREARQERKVWLDPDLDGMCFLTAHLTAADGHRIMARLDAASAHLATAPDEERTRDQLRADVARDLLLNNTDGTPATIATVAVTVPVLALLDAPDAGNDEPEAAANPTDTSPATRRAGSRASTESRRPAPPRDRIALLDGLVPIPPSTARELAGRAPSLHRILTDPIDGAVLTVDRRSYRPPADLKRVVGALHHNCGFPGCGRRAADCDLDHVDAWAEGGATSVANLRPACRAHHRLKHEGNWTVRAGEPGRVPAGGPLRWRSPTGHESDEDPPPF